MDAIEGERGEVREARCASRFVCGLRLSDRVVARLVLPHLAQLRGQLVRLITDHFVALHQADVRVTDRRLGGPKSEEQCATSDKWFEVVALVVAHQLKKFGGQPSLAARPAEEWRKRSRCDLPNIEYGRGPLRHSGHLT